MDRIRDVEHWHWSWMPFRLGQRGVLRYLLRRGAGAVTGRLPGRRRRRSDE
jgi:hypothetical protein